MTLHIRTDRSLIRAEARSTRYVLLSFTAPTAPRREDRRPVNVGFVLDRSGSMSGERKFSLAREAVEQSLRMLREEDRFSLVVYDDNIDVIAMSSHATPRAIRDAVDALAVVSPRGSTDLCSGWMRGCEQVARFADNQRTSRVLLLTDGLANRGVTDPGTLAHHAAELRARGVTTSTFGVGADFDERLLRDMAHEGGGNFYFLEDSIQIPDLITSELGEALEVVMPHAFIEMDIPPRSNAELLNRFRSSTHDNLLRVELGDVVSGQAVEIVVRLTFPQGSVGERVMTSARLGATRDMVRSALVDWTYATHADNDRQPRDREVDRKVAEIYAARARADATEANRHGDLMLARRVIEQTAEKIREYAGNDDVLNGYWRALLSETARYDQAVMSPMAMKQSFYLAELSVKGRSSDGRTRRSTR
jgi:Ca-activated chloride channel family protein